MMEYYMCTGCKREFFSEKEYRNHPCFAQKFDPNGSVAKHSSPTKVGGINANDSNATVDAGKPAGGETPVAALDLRMDAKKELIQMKKELVAAGVSCQTMNEEQTRAEYEKLKGGKPDDGGDGGEAVSAPASSAKKSRKK